jgi:hypothetical protein
MYMEARSKTKSFPRFHYSLKDRRSRLSLLQTLPCSEIPVPLFFFPFTTTSAWKWLEGGRCRQLGLSVPWHLDSIWGRNLRKLLVFGKDQPCGYQRNTTTPKDREDHAPSPSQVSGRAHAQGRRLSPVASSGGAGLVLMTVPLNCR